MKKIAIVCTGGTICSVQEDGMRSLCSGTAKHILIQRFFEENKDLSMLENLFEDTLFPEEDRLLSENMTLTRLSKIINHINGLPTKEFTGIIVLHGTDTLSFTAAMLSMYLAHTAVPIMLVSGNRPPKDENTNAVKNFTLGVRLILNGITPNVYAPYYNSDGVPRLFLASRLMGCPNFSDDFRTPDGTLGRTVDEMLESAKKFTRHGTDNLSMPAKLSTGVLLITPYTGIDYNLYSLDGVKAVVHGTYHSGTVCTDELGAFAHRCNELKIPLIIAPSMLSDEQYSSAYELYNKHKVVLLNSTIESAYAKTVLGVSLGFDGKRLIEFMEINRNFEIV